MMTEHRVNVNDGEFCKLSGFQNYLLQDERDISNHGSPVMLYASFGLNLRATVKRVELNLLFFLDL